MRGRQREKQMLFTVFRADHARLVHGERQDDQLVHIIPQALQQDIVLPYLGGDRHLRIQVG